MELEQSVVPDTKTGSIIPPFSALKLTCTVHGPRPLPRSAPFAPHISLSTHIKFAPFAARQRRGYQRDASERDLAVHLETALKGVIIGDRWPKSGMEIIITVLEGEEDHWWVDDGRLDGGERDMTGASGMMSILSGCITVASAAIIDAGIDCVDLISGGVASMIRSPSDASNIKQKEDQVHIVLDPAPSEHKNIMASCIVGYLQSRDEVTELWIKGSIPDTGVSDECNINNLIESAIQAAVATRRVLAEALKDSIDLKLERRNHHP